MADRRINPEPRMPSIGRMFGNPNRFAPGAKPKNAKGTIRRIAKIYMRFGKTILFAILLTVLSSCFTVAIPYFVGKTINTFDIQLFQVDMQTLSSLLLIIASLYVTNWLLLSISGYIMLKVSQKLVSMLRMDFFQKLEKLPLAFFDTHAHGDLMSRLTNDIDNISVTIAQTTTQLTSSLFTVTLSLIVMVGLNAPLTLTVLVSVPLFAFLTRAVARHSRQFFIEQQKSLGTLNGMIEENITGLKMVKAFMRGKRIMDHFSAENEALYRNGMKAQVWSGLMMPMMNVINNLTFTLVAIVGGVLCISYGVPVGTVVSFLNYSKQFGMPLNAIAGMFNTIQSALAGAERVFETMDEAEETPDADDALEALPFKGDVSFENVCFSYDNAKPILQNISFDVIAGETIALVGETGAGKTTIVNLLTRFYDAVSGQIKIDGIPIQRIKRDCLRKYFSVVLQDTSLFTGSILDNIRYARPEATDDQVIAAAKLARAHPFIEKLPNSYQTIVSGSTSTLSEGQRQLLAIARAVLCDCPILILDEATSSVDTKTEKDIQRALLELMRNHTSFLIAHRLSTIRDADRIIVIEDGKILESGNHEALLAQKGRYYEMVVSQLGLGVEEVNDKRMNAP